MFSKQYYAQNSREIELDANDELHLLKRSSVEVLGGLVAFRPVPSISEWVFCLLLLRDGDGLLLLFNDSGIRDGGEVRVCYFESVSSLDSGGDEAASGGGSFDEEIV